MQELPTWFEVGSLVVLVGLLLTDLAVVARRPHVPSTRESGLWVAFYVGLALVFGVVVLLVPGGGGTPSGEFYAGWLTEYSLSVDNLFVFLLIMTRFKVPAREQQTALMAGILVALVLRGVFILLGAAVLERFSWVFLLFGAFLLYTAVRLVLDRGSDEEYEDNVLIRRLRRVLPLTERYDGARLRTADPERPDGARLFTPMVVVFVAIGSTDLLFALDSIPAIFGLTQDPFIVYTASIFALMGLRQLYFLLGGLLDRLVYLSLGLAVVLGGIGLKLVLEALHSNELPFVNGGEPVPWAPEVPTWVSLVFIVVVLLVTTVASLLRSRRPAHTGS